MSGQLTMYTTPWCGYCRNLKRQLARDGIEMTEIDEQRITLHCAKISPLLHTRQLRHPFRGERATHQKALSAVF